MIRVVPRNYETPADVARELALAAESIASASRITARFGVVAAGLDWREMGNRDDGGKLLREVVEVRSNQRTCRTIAGTSSVGSCGDLPDRREQWHAETIEIH